MSSFVFLFALAVRCGFSTRAIVLCRTPQGTYNLELIEELFTFEGIKVYLNSGQSVDLYIKTSEPDQNFTLNKNGKEYNLSETPQNLSRQNMLSPFVGFVKRPSETKPILYIYYLYPEYSENEDVANLYGNELKNTFDAETGRDNR